VEKNIATDLAYPKIEKTVPHFLTAGEYERILEHCVSVVDRELVDIPRINFFAQRRYRANWSFPDEH
jgi:hypothetical protein